MLHPRKAEYVQLEHTTQDMGHLMDTKQWCCHINNIMYNDAQQQTATINICTYLSKYFETIKTNKTVPMKQLSTE